jgi:AcrR family transcriptional regulator
LSLAAVVDGMGKEILDTVTEISLESNLTLTERLEHNIRQIVKHIAADPVRWRALVRCAEFVPAPQRKAYQRMQQQADAEFRSILTEGIESGEFRSVHLDAWIHGIVAMCNCVFEWYSDESDLTVDELADELATLAVRSIRRADPARAGKNDVKGLLGSLREDVQELEKLLSR